MDLSDHFHLRRVSRRGGSVGRYGKKGKWKIRCGFFVLPREESDSRRNGSEEIHTISQRHDSLISPKTELKKRHWVQVVYF